MQKKPAQKQRKVKDVIVSIDNGKFAISLLVNKSGRKDPFFISLNIQDTVEMYLGTCKRHNVKANYKVIANIQALATLARKANDTSITEVKSVESEANVE